MLVFRWRSRTAASMIWLAVGLLPLVGCGGAGSGEKTRTIYKSPDEVDQKKSDLKEAMQGGAYGSAGRKAAPNMGP